MSGAMSTVFQRLLARKQKLKELIPSLTKSATPSSTSSPLPSTSSTGETTTYKKDRQNALSVKDERTADDPAGGLKENMPDSTTYPITSKISEQAQTEPPAEKRARMEQEEEQEEMSIQALLAAPSTKEKESKKISNEILELLNKPTAKELQLLQKFKSDGSSMQEFCVHGTRQDCARVCGRPKSCDKLHFKKIIQRHTDVSLGDCSFLNTCFHMDTCKYIHYQVDYSTVKERQSAVAGVGAAGAGASNPESTAEHHQPTGPANGHPLLKNRHSSGGSLKSGSEKLSLSEMNPSSSAKLGLLDKTKLSPPQCSSESQDTTSGDTPVELALETVGRMDARWNLMKAPTPSSPSFLGDPAEAKQEIEEWAEVLTASAAAMLDLREVSQDGRQAVAPDRWQDWSRLSDMWSSRHMRTTRMRTMSKRIPE